MTDFRALCARMADELDYYRQLLMDNRRETHALAVEARAALAEADGPAVQSREPASVVEQPSRQDAVALYTEVMALHQCATLGEMAEHFARTVLARWGTWGVSRCHRLQQENHRFREPEQTILCDILANGHLLPDADGKRYGTATPQPIPVSERLPEAGDCDAEGRCWLGGQQMGQGTPTWLLGFPAWADRFPEVHHYWLPAHALPLPSGEVE